MVDSYKSDLGLGIMNIYKYSGKCKRIVQILKNVALATFIRASLFAQATSIQKGTIDPAELRAVDRNKQSQPRQNQTYNRIYHAKDTGATNRKLSHGRGYVITMVSNVVDVPWWPFILKIFLVTYFIYVL